LTPGILSASTDAYGGQVYFVRGSENENHATLLDGADIGSFQQNWPSNYIAMSTEALGDIQVKTGATDASSPSAMGMVINMATPTGGNSFHGAAALLASPRGWKTIPRAALAPYLTPCNPISRSAVLSKRTRPGSLPRAAIFTATMASAAPAPS
jgi:hypothetical protein